MNKGEKNYDKGPFWTSSDLCSETLDISKLFDLYPELKNIKSPPPVGPDDYYNNIDYEEDKNVDYEKNKNVDYEKNKNKNK